MPFVEFSADIYSVEIIHCEFLNCYVQFVMIPLMWPHLALWPEAHYLRLERYSAVTGEVNSGTNADFFDRPTDRFHLTDSLTATASMPL